jgi:hypothetical protein
VKSIVLSEFADNETPAGVIDGANAAYTLAFPPFPAASLQLTRNGLLQAPVADYTLMGNAITFLPRSIPQKTDRLTAFYRH